MKPQIRKSENCALREVNNNVSHRQIPSVYLPQVYQSAQYISSKDIGISNKKDKIVTLPVLQKDISCSLFHSHVKFLALGESWR